MNKIISVRESAALALDSMEQNGAYGGAAVSRQINRVSAGYGAEDYASITDVGASGAGADAADGVLTGNRDAALLRELVYGVTKWKLALDSIIFRYSKLKKQKISPRILTILRLGVYQIVYLDKIPVSAACDESVKLAKKYGNDGSVRFVNALLRKISTEFGSGALPPIQPVDAADMSVRYSYPPWLCERWLGRYGPDFTAALMDAGNGKPEFTVRVNVMRESAASLAEKLRARGYEAAPGRYSKNALIIANPGNFSRTPEFCQGFFTVQDESSMLAAEALTPKPGDRILDICAAPGGKSGYIAELTGDSADITAADIRPYRIILMEQNFKRLGLKSIRCVETDAVVFNPQYEGAMDRVLLDAPCSGFGVIRRKPEIKWLRQPADIVEIAKLQSAALNNASRYVAGGGVLVYSVCAFEPEECGDVVRGFLNGSGGGMFEPEDVTEYLPPSLSDKAVGCRDNAGVYLYPHLCGTDGFFIARLKKRRER